MLALPVVGAALAAVLIFRTGAPRPEAAFAASAGGSTSADAGPSPTAVAAPAPAPAEAAGPTPLQVRQATLLATLSALASQSTVDFSVAIVDHNSGATFSFAGDQSFETASVVKVDILATLLLQARQDGHGLSADQQDLADVMITESDNDAASTLWDEIGDAYGLQQANQTFGLTSTNPGDDGYWGLTMTTAADQVRLLDAIANPKGPLGSSNATLLTLMGQVDTDQDWGVSAAARTGETTLLKNGWLSLDDDNGLWEVNSIGRITGTGIDLSIAVMSHGNDNLDDGIALVEQIAQLTRSQLAL
jgi:beta-lactamase class A